VEGVVIEIEHATPSLSSSDRRSTLWPPNLQDLNSVDYSIWVLLQEKVCHSRIITDLQELKTRLGDLIDEWG